MNFFTRLIKFFKKESKYKKLKNMNPKNYRYFLEQEYFERNGEKPNLDNPQKYTEKMQYAKVHLNTPFKTVLSDKYKVREWISEKIGPEYLIPLIGVWDNANDINFRELPEQFVLKTNGGSGTNIIVTDKSNLNISKTKFKLNYWLNRDFAFDGDIQLHYSEIEPKIIAEEYIKLPEENLIDYRFICFNGIVYYCWVDFYTSDNTHYSNIYDLQWNLQLWRFKPMENTPYELNKPQNFEEMISIVKVLAEGFSHVRVDLYNVDGRIFFGEMTFTSTGGYRLITPEKYNYELGNLWDITGNN